MNGVIAITSQLNSHSPIWKMSNSRRGVVGMVWQYIYKPKQNHMISLKRQNKTKWSLRCLLSFSPFWWHYYSFLQASCPLLMPTLLRSKIVIAIATTENIFHHRHYVELLHARRLPHRPSFNGLPITSKSPRHLPSRFVGRISSCVFDSNR